MENYRALYKVAAKSGKLRGEKRETARLEQKRKRENTFLERRNIQEQEPSTSAAPSPAKSKPQNVTRRDKLLRWKAEKDKLIAQQKLQEKKRPPFKVGVAHHALDPVKELVALPIRGTTVKCTTSKKAAAESRSIATENRKAKAPTAASSSLASFAATSAAPNTSAAFSGRVTRSRSAAAVAVSKKAVEVKPKRALTTSRNPKASNTKGVVVSKPVKKVQETSFAPKDHKFKAPTSLTLPTTPLALKRSASKFKEVGWPTIDGVGLLSPTSLEPSPKIAKKESAALQRRGRLTRTVKEKTPKKSSSTRKQKTPKKSPLLVKEKTPVKSPKVVESTDVKSESAKKMPRLSRRSGGFIVTDMPSVREESKMSCTIIEETDNDIEMSLTNSATCPKRSINSSKKRQSVREKENVPAVDKASGAEESFSLSLPEVAEFDSIVDGSRRMSIHEPSPPVFVSPDKLSNGMVPAQFSPFVTSARGKDKYSLKKRRSSLIPIVPEVSAEVLVIERQVEHFRNLLERESSRLLTLSALWEERKVDTPPAVQDKILGAVGQARLLVKDKFQQFRKLVDKFESGDPDGKITADDLTGFWEMMLLTVENIDKRFQELEDIKVNNWQEKPSEAPVHKPVPVVPAASKPTKPRTQAQSRLKGLIEAARKRKLEAKQNKSTNVSSDTTTFDGGFFKVESPKKALPSPKPVTQSPAPKISKPVVSTPRQFHRRSLLQQVLTNSAVRVHNSPAATQLNTSLSLSASPKVAAAQMRASELGRRMSMDSGNATFSPEPSSPVLKAEPTKSILKSAARKSMRLNTPRNRVVFEVLNQSENSSPGSPVLVSPAGTPVSQRMATPGNRKRASLIPRPISTPKTAERVSLIPKRQSLAPSRPSSSGDLIDFSSPRRASRS